MITESQAREVIEECKQLSALPDGYTMKLDRKTHNVLVCGPNLGFCISEKAMKEGRYKTEFPPCLKKLLECEANLAADPLLVQMFRLEKLNSNG